MQKAKLEEQNKLIEQLKYNKIVDASQQSLITMKEDIRRTYYEIDKHLKPKIKNLTNELKIKDFEGNFLFCIYLVHSDLLVEILILYFRTISYIALFKSTSVSSENGSQGERT